MTKAPKDDGKKAVRGGAGADPVTGRRFGYHELERVALAFVLETETWPVFLEWVRVNHVSPESHAWLEAGPDLAAMRRQWAAHSPDPDIRAGYRTVNTDGAG